MAAAAAAAAAAVANATAVDRAESKLAAAVDRAESKASKDLSNMKMPHLADVAYYDWLNAIDSAGILYGWHRSIYVHTVQAMTMAEILAENDVNTPTAVKNRLDRRNAVQLIQTSLNGHDAKQLLGFRENHNLLLDPRTMLRKIHEYHHPNDAAGKRFAEKKFHALTMGSQGDNLVNSRRDL